MKDLQSVNDRGNNQSVTYRSFPTLLSLRSIKSIKRQPLIRFVYVSLSSHKHTHTHKQLVRWKVAIAAILVIIKILVLPSRAKIKEVITGNVLNVLTARVIVTLSVSP